MLEVKGLNSFYGDSHIVHGVSFKVGEKQRVALIGRNGVGKSTLLKSLMNAGPRATGEVIWDGKPLGSAPAFERARLGMALVPEDRRILPDVTVLENLEMAQRGVADVRKTADPRQVLNSFPMLVPLESRPGARLSGGQQQMLAVARAIVARPRLMLLDEPTEGLAPVIVQQLVKAVVDTCEEAGAALLLCEQNLWFARRCTEYVHVLDSGAIVFSGTWAEFNKDDSIKRRYLTV
jgi:ABC-type branched-subunit amino acid transport system ATPase component